MGINNDKYCQRDQCKEPISEGLTLIRYYSQNEKILSFHQSEHVTIYSKGDKHQRDDYWEGQIKGKRGYLPARFIRETKIFKRNLIGVPLDEQENKVIQLDNEQKLLKEVSPKVDTNNKESANVNSIEQSKANVINSPTASVLSRTKRIESSTRNEWFSSKASDILSLPWEGVNTIGNIISSHADKFSSTLFKGFYVTAQESSYSLDGKDSILEVDENMTYTIDSDLPFQKAHTDKTSSTELNSQNLIASSLESIIPSSAIQQNTPLISEIPEDIKTSVSLELDMVSITQQIGGSSKLPANLANSMSDSKVISNAFSKLSDLPAEDLTRLPVDTEEFTNVDIQPTYVEDTEMPSATPHLTDTEVVYNDNHLYSSEHIEPQSVTKSEDTETEGGWFSHTTKILLGSQDEGDNKASNNEALTSEINIPNSQQNSDGQMSVKSDNLEEEFNFEDDDEDDFQEEEDATVEDDEDDTEDLLSEDDLNDFEEPPPSENTPQYQEDEKSVKEIVEDNDSVNVVRSEENDKPAASVSFAGNREIRNGALEKNSSEDTNFGTEDHSAEIKKDSKENDQIYSQNELDKSIKEESDYSRGNFFTLTSIIPEQRRNEPLSKEDELPNVKNIIESSADHSHGNINKLGRERVDSEETFNSVNKINFHDYSQNKISGVSDEHKNIKVESQIPVHPLFPSSAAVDGGKGDSSNLPTEEVAVGEEMLTPEPAEDKESSNSESILEIIISVPGDFHHITKQYVDALRPYVQIVIDMLPSFMKDYLIEFEEHGLSPRVLVFTYISGFFMWLTLISYYLVKRKNKENKMIEKLCKLDKLLFEAITERDCLKEELNSSKLTINDIDQTLNVGQETIQSLEIELLNSKNESHKLQETVRLLKDQLDHQTSSVKQLQASVKAKAEQYSKLEESNQAVETANSELKEQIQQMKDNLEESDNTNNELDSRIKALETENSGLQESNSQLLKEAEIWNQRIEELQQQLQLYQNRNNDLEESLDLKNGELKVLQECVLQLKVVIQDEASDDKTGSEKLEKLMDVSRITLDLKTLSEENTDLAKRFKDEENLRKSLEEQLLSSSTEVERLSMSNSTLQQERDEAQQRLQILSNYFKEKEIELQRELGVQEAKRQETLENASNISQRAASYEEEISLYKSQIDSLKKEIENQNRSFKNQISLLENKVHDNWLAARAAERRTEEAKQESSVLRNKLTLLEQDKEIRNRTKETDAMRSKGHLGSNGEIPSPAQLDSESMDMTVPRPSPLLRDPLEPPHPLNFLPQDRPVPPPPFRMPMLFLQRPPLPLPHMPSVFDLRAPPPPGHPFNFDAYPPPQRPLFPRGLDPFMPPPPRDHRMSPQNRISPPFEQGSPPPRDYHHSPPLDRRNFPDRYSSPPPFDRRPPSGRRLSPVHAYERQHPHDRESHITSPPPRFPNIPPNSRTFERFPPNPHLGIRPLQPPRRDANPSDSQKGDTPDTPPRSTSSFSVDQQDETITAV